MLFESLNYQNKAKDEKVRFAFSLHKCGSSLLNGIISDVCKLEAIANVNIPETMFRNGVADNTWQTNISLVDCIKPGYLHYGFRAMPQSLSRFFVFWGIQVSS